MSWNEFERQLDRGPVHSIFAFWKLGCVVLVLLGITSCGVWFVTRPAAVVGSILDGDNVTYNYEWFKEAHEDYNSLTVKIRDAEAAFEQYKTDAGPRKSWHREDREEVSRLGTIVLGLKHQQADLAAKYNARSRMVNRSIFMGTDTPAELPVE